MHTWVLALMLVRVAVRVRVLEPGQVQEQVLVPLGQAVGSATRRAKLQHNQHIDLLLSLYLCRRTYTHNRCVRRGGHRLLDDKRV
jgi:hypothetical protein